MLHCFSLGPPTVTPENTTLEYKRSKAPFSCSQLTHNQNSSNWTGLVPYLWVRHVVNKRAVDAENSVSVFHPSQLSRASHFQAADQVTLFVTFQPQVEAKGLSWLLVEGDDLWLESRHVLRGRGSPGIIFSRCDKLSKSAPTCVFWVVLISVVVVVTLMLKTCSQNMKVAANFGAFVTFKKCLLPVSPFQQIFHPS